jgi:hypothetical protein
MKPSNLIKYTLAVLTAATALFGATGVSQAQAKKPNIVVIMTDDVGVWNISAYHRGMMKATSKPNFRKNSIRSVRNGASLLPAWRQNECMRHKKPNKESLDDTRASVKREMARPRMAKSARIMRRKLDTGRTPEQPSTTMPGKVAKIIPSRNGKQPEKAQIAVGMAAPKYRNLRIENSLTDEHGDEVRLKKGAQVEVTVAAESIKRQS